MFVYVAVLACAVALGWLVYRYDMYEKEPWYMVVLALGAGMAAMWMVGYAEDATLAALDWDNSAAGRSAVASTHEEAARLLVVLLIAWVFGRHCNDPMDGIIYGGYVGLGMAIEESIFYLRISPLGVEVVGREAVRLVLHMLMGGIGGYGLSVAWFRSKRWRIVLPATLAAALVLHFAWDYLIGLAPEGPTPLQRGFAVVLMLGAIALFGVLVKTAGGRSRRLYAPGTRRRWWGWPFTLLAAHRRARVAVEPQSSDDVSGT